MGKLLWYIVIVWPARSCIHLTGGKVMNDPTEKIRREMVAEQLILKAARVLAGKTDEDTIADLRKAHPDACNTDELKQQYNVTGFLAPFISCTRRSDGVKGTMNFIHSPRIYFDFKPK